jgi:predicted metal-dependent hydrolase
MPDFNYNDKSYKYEIIKKSNKNISIKISNDGEIIVVSPYRISELTINEIIAKKSVWIVKKLEEIKSRENRTKPLEFKNFEKILYKGNYYPINIVESMAYNCEVDFVNSGVEIKVNTLVQGRNRRKIIETALQNWYRDRCEEVIKARTAYYSKLLALYPTKLTVKRKAQITLWGSCSSKGSINFNYRLILAPEKVIDYIVVHELCHLKYMNHSKEFYCMVKNIIPDYKNCISYLKTNSRILQK